MLNASSTYIVSVRVVYAHAGDRSVASSSVVVQVGQSGVQAVITGGSVQTFSSRMPITIDAASSFDVDYPTSSSQLLFTWTCVGISPNYGSECPGSSAFASSRGVPSLYLQANRLNITTATSLNVTVFVSNKVGSSASASVTLNILAETIPVVTIGAFASLQIVGQNIVLSGSVKTIASAVAAWSSPSIALSSVSLTPVVKSFSAGTSLFQLAIDSTSFRPGLSYTFQLGATYNLQPGAAMAAVAQVVVRMNSPPVGGIVSVLPSAGFAFNTTFTIRTYSWTTDPANYPLLYVLSHLPSPQASSVVLKTISTLSAVSSILSQGLLFNNFNTTCVAVATDVLGSASRASAVVKVEPLAVSSVQVAQVAVAAIQTALTNNDPSAVAALVGAVSTSLNAVNCSVPQKCSSINRQECSTTPRTCGPCIGSFIGVSGDSNIPCGRLDTLSKIGDACMANANCMSGLCVGGVCSDVQKSCPNDCSGRGTCALLDLLGQSTPSCSASSSFCTAVCQCSPPWRGGDCSLSQSAMDSLRATRAALCVGMYRTASIQDVTADVLVMRASTIAAVLMDMSQITDAALFNCTAALVGTITAHPSLAGAPGTASVCATALSNVLAKGPALPRQLAGNVSNALTALAMGVQSYMAVGQSFNNITTSNARLTTGVVYSSDLATQRFSPPQSSAEVFEGAAKTNVAINSSSPATTGVGISLLQYNNNAFNSTSAVSAGIGIQAFAYAAADNGQRRLLDAQNNSFDSTYTFVIPNFQAVNFAVHRSSTRAVYCLKASTAHEVVVTCPNGKEFKVVCPSNVAGFQNYSCPTSYLQPKCEEYGGGRFSPTPLCRVVASTPFNVTCQCVRGPVVGGRRLAESPSDAIQQYTTSATIVTTEFISTFESAKDLNLAAVQKNKTVLILMSVVVALFFIGFATLVSIDAHEVKKRQDKIAKERVSTLPINDFLDLALPQEFQDTPWFIRLWNKLLIEHPWICLFGSFRVDTDVRVAMWMRAIVHVINFIFVDTVLAGLFFVDTGRCGMYTAKTACLQTKSLDKMDSLCVWEPALDDPSVGTCSFNSDIGSTFLSTLVLTNVISVVAVPFDGFVDYLVNNVRDYLVTTMVKKRKKQKYVADTVMNQELIGAERRRIRFMRGARLAKMKASMDNTSVMAEMQNLLTYQKSEKRWFRFEVIRAMKMGAKPSFLRRWIDKMSEKLASHVVRGDELVLSETSPLRNKVKGARSSAFAIVSAMKSMKSDAHKELYLYQRFLISFCSGFRRDIAAMFFKASNVRAFGLKKRHKPTMFQRLSCLLLLGYVFGTSFYVFLFGVSIGPNQTKLWLMGSFQSFILDVVILTPMKVWVKWIALAVISADLVRSVHHTTKSKAKLVLTRRWGLMYHANSLIQSLNPACRAAREFPHLGVSRLLMSLNDFDIDKYRVPEQKLFAEIIGFIFLLLLIGLVLLPEIIQNTFLETAVTSLVNLAILGSFLTATFNMGLLVIPMIVIGSFMLVTYSRWKRYSNSAPSAPASNSNSKEDSDDGPDGDAGPDGESDVGDEPSLLTMDEDEDGSHIDRQSNAHGVNGGLGEEEVPDVIVNIGVNDGIKAHLEHLKRELNSTNRIPSAWKWRPAVDFLSHGGGGGGGSSMRSGASESPSMTMSVGNDPTILSTRFRTKPAAPVAMPSRLVLTEGVAGGPKHRRTYIDEDVAGDSQPGVKISTRSLLQGIAKPKPQILAHAENVERDGDSSTSKAWGSVSTVPSWPRVGSDVLSQYGVPPRGDVLPDGEAATRCGYPATTAPCWAIQGPRVSAGRQQRGWLRYQWIRR